MTGWRAPAGILGTALLCAACAQGGWWLAPVMLVPWLHTLDATAGMRRTLPGAIAMTLVFTLAVFGWFGIAIGRFTGWGDVAGIAVLGVIAPILQPQFIAFALVRTALRGRLRWPLRALAGACAWVACEWLWPKLLGDTLGHGVVPSAWWRQLADVGGAAGISFVLVLLNLSLIHI